MDTDREAKRVIVAVEVTATSERTAYECVNAALRVASLEDAPELGQIFVRAAIATEDIAYPILRRADAAGTPSPSAADRAKIEQRLENDQVRRMQESGRCPCCGADA